MLLNKQVNVNILISRIEKSMVVRGREACPAIRYSRIANGLRRAGPRLGLAAWRRADSRGSLPQLARAAVQQGIGQQLALPLAFRRRNALGFQLHGMIGRLELRFGQLQGATLAQSIERAALGTSA